MLLLLESRPANRRDAYNRVIRAILHRYLENDFRSFRVKVPRFLLNDLHRYWRTLCVDYASKYLERRSKGWALRNIKLRMSRKLIFAAGQLICYSCDPRLLAQTHPTLVSNPVLEEVVNYLRGQVDQYPLDLMAEALVRYAQPETAQSMLNAYNAFLTHLDDPEVREHLDGLRPEEAGTDTVFQEMQGYCRSFQGALQALFFTDDPTLTALSQEYGVF